MNDRIFRAMVKSFKVTDLPKDARMRWVNYMTNELVEKLQRNPRGDPAEVLKRMVQRATRDFAHGVARWASRLPYNPRDVLPPLPQE